MYHARQDYEGVIIVAFMGMEGDLEQAKLNIFVWVVKEVGEVGWKESSQDQVVLCGDMTARQGQSFLPSSQ